MKTRLHLNTPSCEVLDDNFGRETLLGRQHAVKPAPQGHLGAPERFRRITAECNRRAKQPAVAKQRAP